MANAAADGVTWVVDSQVARIVDDGRGQYVPGYHIDFTTGLGNRGSIEVARSAYNPANVVALIKAHASELDAVSKSGG